MAIQPKSACKPTGESQCLGQLAFIKLFNGNILNQYLAIMFCSLCFVSGICVSQLQSSPFFVRTGRPAHAAMCLVDQPLFQTKEPIIFLRDDHLFKTWDLLSNRPDQGGQPFHSMMANLQFFCRCSFSDCSGSLLRLGFGTVCVMFFVPLRKKRWLFVKRPTFKNRDQQEMFSAHAWNKLGWLDEMAMTQTQQMAMKKTITNKTK